MKKESRGRILNENFDFNPKNLLVITDKPTTVKKMSSGEVKEENKESMDALKKKLEVLTTVPKKKYPYPMTAAQEVGWENDALFNVHKPKYSFNRQMYAETKYANEYQIANHVSPFASRKPVAIDKK